MKASRIVWGILIIALAVVLILQGIGVLGSFTSMFGVIPIWKVLLGLALLAVVISCMVKLRFEGVFLPLAVIFLLFEKNIAFACSIEGDIVNNWLVLGCAVLLSVGFALLIPKRKRNRKHGKKIGVNIDDDGRIEVEAEDVDETDADFDDDCDEQGGDFGTANTRYFDGATFKSGYVETKMGATEVSFENADKYTGGGVIKLNCKMGAIEINVPKEWRVESDIKVILGAATCSHKNKDPDAPVLTVVGTCKLGAIEIQ